MEQLCRLHSEGFRRPGKGKGDADDVLEGLEEPNYKEAHKWGLKAYEKGLTVAGYYLGIIYEQDHAPRGVDHALAVQWYLAACQKSVRANKDASAHAEPSSALCGQAGPDDETVGTEAMVGLGRCFYKGATWDADLSVPARRPLTPKPFYKGCPWHANVSVGQLHTTWAVRVLPNYWRPKP